MSETSERLTMSKLFVYATCVNLGISIMMPLNALTSAPSYMIDYYKYASGDENATPNSPVFWANILTFYNLASVVTQAAIGPTVLTPWARKLSLTFRFFMALFLMMVELFVILVIPAGRVSQVGAMVAFFIVSIAAGVGKSYLEATCYALVGTMPPSFMSAIMLGCGLSGVIASVLQCIVKASMDSDYQAVLRQAYIYFSLALAFMISSLTMALCLRYNTYAQQHIGEFRAIKRAKDIAAGKIQPEEEEQQQQQELAITAAREPAGEVCGDIVMDDKEKKAIQKAEAVDGSSEPSEADEVQAVDRQIASNLSESNFDDRNLTTSQQMQRTHAMPVVKLIWPVMLACFLNFFISLLIFPSLVLPVDRTDKWFTTIAILLYNCGDAFGRWSSSLKFLWPSRKVLLILIGCRAIFIPLTFLCIYKYIPGHVAPYIFFGLLGLTNGFCGATSMVLGPIDPRLRTDGQRVMAGQLMGVSLLAGASVSALLALLIVLYIP